MNEHLLRSSMLSDVDIRRYFGKEINIYTTDNNDEYKFNIDKQLQPASIDLRFRHECKRFKKDLNGNNLNYEMLKNHEYTDPFEISNKEKLIINPGEMIFTTTLETVVISDNFAGLITGRSGIARLGIMVHCCQEFINPGQKSPIALQITNLGKFPVELDLRIPICQLILFKLSSPSSKEYRSMDSAKYKNEESPMTSQIYLEVEDNHGNSSKKRNGLSVINKFFRLIDSVMRRYISPLLPSVLMFLLVTPFLTQSKSITIGSIFFELFSVMKTLPIYILLTVVAVALYIYYRKDD